MIRRASVVTSRHRRGVAAVEGATVILAFLTLILGLLDFGLAVLNYNNLTSVAGRLGRAAIVHGNKSGPELTPWGPATYTGTAADGGEIPAAVRPYLATMPAAQVQIRVEWPDGGNAVGQRVMTTVTYQQRLIFTHLFGVSSWTQQAVTVMRIQH
jgi:Flp pilus assembly protein TadG